MSHLSHLVVALPPNLSVPRLREELGADLTPEFVVWDHQGRDPVDPATLDLVVLPFHTTSRTPNPGYVGTQDLARTLPRLTRARLVQLQSLGSEGVPELVPPGAALANAVGVMEEQTAELAVTLLLAGHRDLVHHVRTAGTWANRRSPGLFGRRVLVLGFGGVGQAVVQRLRGFGVEIVIVAATARTTADGTVVHSITELPDLLTEAEAVVCTLPLNGGTRRLLDTDALAALPDGSLVVNVGRGAVLDTDALVAELRSGRLRAALDVTDPEPLPPDHELWNLPGVLITPHVGGNTEVMPQRLHELVARQIRNLALGLPCENVLVHPKEAAACPVT